MVKQADVLEFFETIVEERRQRIHSLRDTLAKLEADQPALEATWAILGAEFEQRQERVHELYQSNGDTLKSSGSPASDLLESVLRDVGTPMHISEIQTVLINRDIHKSLETIGGVMRKATDRFIKVGPNTFGLVGRDR